MKKFIISIVLVASCFMCGCRGAQIVSCTSSNKEEITAFYKWCLIHQDASYCRKNVVIAFPDQCFFEDAGYHYSRRSFEIHFK
jgi:hypothetical protein